MTLKALIALLGGTRAAIFASIALAALLAAGVQTHRLGNRTDTVKLLEARALNWEAANRDNVTAIAELSSANMRWAGLADKRTQEAAAAATAANAERDRLQAELNQRRRERGFIYESHPDAAVWGRQRVPDSIADQLRR
ncbi:MAG: hypothetical protein KA763_00510 [Xanthomonadales bacterium]|nr:hypothetical protein [Xanthomonadales bacterium]